MIGSIEQFAREHQLLLNRISIAGWAAFGLGSLASSLRSGGRERLIWLTLAALASLFAYEMFSPHRYEIAVHLRSAARGVGGEDFDRGRRPVQAVVVAASVVVAVGPPREAPRPSRPSRGSGEDVRDRIWDRDPGTDARDDLVAPDRCLFRHLLGLLFRRDRDGTGGGLRWDQGPRTPRTLRRPDRARSIPDRRPRPRRGGRTGSPPDPPPGLRDGRPDDPGMGRPNRPSDSPWPWATGSLRRPGGGLAPSPGPIVALRPVSREVRRDRRSHQRLDGPGGRQLVR